MRKLPVRSMWIFIALPLFAFSPGAFAQSGNDLRPRGEVGWFGGPDGLFVWEDEECNECEPPITLFCREEDQPGPRVMAYLPVYDHVQLGEAIAAGETPDLLFEAGDDTDRARGELHFYELNAVWGYEVYLGEWVVDYLRAGAIVRGPGVDQSLPLIDGQRLEDLQALIAGCAD